jgi:hypothetical protein
VIQFDQQDGQQDVECDGARAPDALAIIWVKELLATVSPPDGRPRTHQ